MKYIKKYEKAKDKTIYSSSDFNIMIQSNGAFSYNSKYISCPAIFGMAILISEKSPFIYDPKLREIIIPKDKLEYELNNINLETPQKRKNIREYRSGVIKYFITMNIVELKKIPEEVYMILTEKYYPIIYDAISESETLGDIIDNFKIIHKNLIKDLKYHLTVNKYNI